MQASGYVFMPVILSNNYTCTEMEITMDIMDVAGLSTTLSSTQLINDVQVAVLKQSLDTLETNGDGLTKMMEASVNPGLGQNIDIRI